MSKKKKTEEYNNSLEERLDTDLLSKLALKKKDLKQQKEKAEKEAQLKKAAERKQREANKSFEELLSESEMDWRKFK